jgi:hypothetical protein
MYNTETRLETIFEYYDLPFGDHPWDEFGVKILGCMNCFSFIVWQ